ncbi:MAG: hypothetical protein R2705_20795 [Ilumatobacteraceae bacterium]
MLEDAWAPGQQFFSIVENELEPAITDGDLVGRSGDLGRPLQETPSVRSIARPSIGSCR